MLGAVCIGRFQEMLKICTLVQGFELPYCDAQPARLHPTLQR